MTDGKIRGIIFDKDGTLFNYAEVWGPLISKTVDTIMMTFNIKAGEREVAKERLAALLGVGTDGKTYPSGILFHHNKKAKAIMKLFIYCLHYRINPFGMGRIFKSITKDPAEGIESELRAMDFSDVRSLFKKLKDHGIFIGVVTNDTTSSAKTCLKCMGLENYVRFLRTKESNCKSKPHPDAINQFCSFYGLKSSEVAVVGDTVADMEFGQNGKAGYIVAVLTGSKDKEALEKQSDIIYPSVGALIDDKTLFPIE